MIYDFLVVLMTKNLNRQLGFYRDFLGLEQHFDNGDTIGLGKQNRLFLALREDKDEDSHHLTTQKGPKLLTFRCEGLIEPYREKVDQAGYTVRDKLSLPDYDVEYLFIEDVEGNEICLEFPYHEL